MLYIFRNLDKSLASFHPDIIVYNAGTDILEGDSLGLLSISALVRTVDCYQQTSEELVELVALKLPVAPHRVSY